MTHPLPNSLHQEAELQQRLWQRAVFI